MNFKVNIDTHCARDCQTVGLFQQQAPRLRHGSGDEPVKINTGSHRLTQIVTPVPKYLIGVPAPRTSSTSRRTRCPAALNKAAHHNTLRRRWQAFNLQPAHCVGKDQFARELWRNRNPRQLLSWHRGGGEGRTRLDTRYIKNLRYSSGANNKITLHMDLGTLTPSRPMGGPPHQAPPTDTGAVGVGTLIGVTEKRGVKSPRSRHCDLRHAHGV